MGWTVQARTTGAGGRLPNLEVLRGLAAVAVVVSHAYGLSGTGVPFSADNLVDAVMMTMPAGVWLFFCISGLVICRPFVQALVSSTERPRIVGYGVRRVLRIFPLYLTCALAVLLLVGPRGESPASLLSHVVLLHNLVPGHQQDFIGVSWTLTLELLFYAVVPVLALVLSRCWRRPLRASSLANAVLGTAVASVAWMLAAPLVGTGDDGLYLRMLLPSMWSAFCPGILIALLLVADPEELRSSATLRALDRLRMDQRQAWSVGGVAFAVAFASAFAQPDWGTIAYLWVFDLGRVAWSIGFGVLVLRAVHAPARTTRATPALDALGLWSYGIYLIHGTVLTILLAGPGQWMIPMPHGGFVAFVVHVAFLLGLTLPLAWLSWHVVEQPAMRAARALGRSRGAAPGTTDAADRRRRALRR